MIKIALRLFFVLLLSVLASCSATKFVPQDEYLLHSVAITTDTKEVKPSELTPFLHQRPNASTLGVVKLQLHLYSLSGRDSSKWFNQWVRRAGSAPVLYDSVLSVRSQTEIQRALSNRGYMNAQVDQTVSFKKKKASVVYHVTEQEPYRLRSFAYNVSDKEMLSIIERDSANAILYEGILFDRALLDKERERVTELVRNHGYYRFSSDLITYTADSTRQTKKIDLTLNVRSETSTISSGKSEESSSRYRINRVFVSLQPPNGSDSTMVQKSDTILHRGIYAISNGDAWIDPRTLINSCYIAPGMTYSDRMVDNTYSSFNRLPVIKYINIRFDEVAQGDSLLLDCYMDITEGKTTSLNFELMGTNTAGDLGFAASAGYQFRNTFKRGVTLGLKARGAYENLSGLSGAYLSNNYQELGGEASLTFPTFVFPFLSNDFRRRFRASSELSVNYNNQSRPEYERIFSGGAWTYKWNASSRTRHSFDLLNLSFVNVPRMDPDFERYLLEQSAMMYLSFESHFILGTGYRFFNTNQVQGRFQRDVYSLRASVESAGNLLYLVSHLSNDKKDSDGYYEFFGLPYSQYIRTDINYVRSLNFSPSHSLNFHSAIGVAFPYGNAPTIPYEKRFYGGGANSVRGWSVRSLGPGSFYDPSLDLKYAYALQLGDIRLDLSVEHRAKLFWKFESALFFDAGNVWSIEEDPDMEGGGFMWNKFYKQIALGYGAGLRLNFDYFIVRLDWGFKLFDPAGAGRWVRPFSGGDNTVHFAIGYPF